jgi:hypothetical protein
MGGLWRYPTKAEITELFNNCTVTAIQSTTSGGVTRNYAKFKSKKNSGTVYFPLCGYYGAGDSSKGRVN